MLASYQHTAVATLSVYTIQYISELLLLLPPSEVCQLPNVDYMYQLSGGFLAHLANLNLVRTAIQILGSYQLIIH